MADRPMPRVVAHPTAFTYFRVAMLLAALTGVEVGVFYIDALEPAFLPIFLILSVAKFALVVMFYMHLKFDARIFSGMFVGGLMLAISVVIVLMGLFQVLSAKANAPEGIETVAHDEGTLPEAPVAEESPAVVPDVTEPGADSSPADTPADLPPVVPDLDGQAIFETAPDSVGAQALWCSTCHTIEGVSVGQIGPDLTHIATDAAGRIPGMSAEDYLIEAVRSPDAFVAEGVDRAIPGLMVNAITEKLTDDQVNALVEFLLQQE